MCLDSCMCSSVCVCAATATDGLTLQAQAERKEKPPSTTVWWKHLFSMRQLFTFPAYWMSSCGYLSFAECIINRWTSRSALILGNGRNVESTVDAHIHTLHPLSSCCCCSRNVCVDIYCLLYALCAVCVYVSFCTWRYVVCVRVCVWQSKRESCLCGPAMWQKNSPLTLSPLHWFTWSDLITSKCTTVSTVHSAAGKQLDDTVCAVMLNFTRIKGCFTSSNQMTDTTQ